MKLALPVLLAAAMAAGASASPPDVEAALVAALALRDPLTGAHVRRTGELAAELAPALGVDPARARRGGRLHDLGKLAMPDGILRGTHRLSATEFTRVKLHPIHGRQLAEEAGLDPALLPAIAAHHERWDGAGYPTGLAGEAIPPLARVVSVADVIDAVTARRSYQAARPFDDALRILREAAGTQLDPAVVAYATRIAPRLRALVERWQGLADPGAGETRR